MISLLLKNVRIFTIVALFILCSSTAIADDPTITTDKTSYNPWETVDIYINESSNITAYVINPENSLTELILTSSETAYVTNYSPQQGVVLGTYIIFVNGNLFSETANFDIRSLFINTDIESEYSIGDIVLSGNVTDAASQEPVNASVNITIDNLTISTYALNGIFSTNYSVTSTGQKVVSITAIDNQNITGSTTAELEVYDLTTANLTSSTSQPFETATTSPVSNGLNITAEPLETNSAPMLSSIGSQTVNESESLTITLNATDNDADILTYSTNATFGNLMDNVFTWIPDTGDCGVYHMEFMASDAILNDTEIVTITVNAKPPEINSIANTPDHVLQGETINITTNVTDDLTVDLVWVKINSTNYTMQNIGKQEAYSLTMQPGNEGKDSFLDSRNPTTNYGSYEHLYITNTNFQERALLEFNILDIPANANITSAQLELYYYDGGGSSTGHIEAHRLTQSWIEAGVTWNSYNGYVSWTSAGGDYDTTVEDTVSISNVYGWYGWNITNLVEVWYNGTYMNYGIILTKNGNKNSKSFYSSDYSNSDYHPKLTINYTIINATNDWNYIFNTSSLSSGIYDYTVYAKNTAGSEAVPQTANFTVRANEPSILSLIESQTVNESETLTITLSATDPDEQTITYGTNATFGNLTDNVFTWTTDYTDSGVYYVEFTASDGELNDSETITITVNETYIDISIVKSIEKGTEANSYNVTLKLTNNAEYNITGIRTYELILSNFKISSQVHNYSGSYGNMYYWDLNLAAGESKTVTYAVSANQKYCAKDLFRIGVTYS
jgi:hypothetical protein